MKGGKGLQCLSGIPGAFILREGFDAEKALFSRYYVIT